MTKREPPQDQREDKAIIRGRFVTCTPFLLARTRHMCNACLLATQREDVGTQELTSTSCYQSQGEQRDHVNRSRGRSVGVVV